MLLAAPPLLHLDVSVMPESWLPWLASLPLATLRIDDRLDVASAQGQGMLEAESSFFQCSREARSFLRRCLQRFFAMPIVCYDRLGAWLAMRACRG